MSSGPHTGRESARKKSDRPFLVEVGALLRDPGTHRRLELAGALPDLAVSGSSIDEHEPVTFSVLLEAVHDGILASGKVRATWHGICRRCAEPASGDLEVEVRELCVEHGDEETTYPLTGDQLDLEPLVHDACILNLPLAPLCRDACLGLCPSCGINRNLENCQCAPARDPRFGVLSVLRGSDDDDASGTEPPTKS